MFYNVDRLKVSRTPPLTAPQQSVLINTGTQFFDRRQGALTSEPSQRQRQTNQSVTPRSHRVGGGQSLRPYSVNPISSDSKSQSRNYKRQLLTPSQLSIVKLYEEPQPIFRKKRKLKRVYTDDNLLLNIIENRQQDLSLRQSFKNLLAAIMKKTTKQNKGIMVGSSSQNITPTFKCKSRSVVFGQVTNQGSIINSETGTTIGTSFKSSRIPSKKQSDAKRTKQLHQINFHQF